jgi:hypothetical protein
MARIIREDRVPYPNTINVIHKLETPLENGQVLGVKGFATGQRELYEVGAYTEGDMIAILTAATLQYDERKDERDFALVKDKAGKANYIQKGEVYTIAVDLVHAAPAIGDKLLVSGNKFAKSTDGNGAVAIVRKKDLIFGGQKSVTIEIL